VEFTCSYNIERALEGDEDVFEVLDAIGAEPSSAELVD
jgi:hypothetical protein